MSFVYIGIYTLFLAIIWGFFILARLHAYQFKEFSKNIVPITQTLFVVLLVCSLLGYGLLIFGDFGGNNFEIDIRSDSNTNPQSITY